MIHGYYYDSLGRGGSIQLFGLSGTTLENAAMISKFRGGSLDEFVNAACEQITAIRGAINGTPVNVCLHLHCLLERECLKVMA